MPNININGVLLDISDHDGSVSVPVILDEMNRDAYGVDGIEFSDGDAVIDVGAHVGVFSIYVAKRHPEVKVFAFEPYPPTYELLLRNIEANGVKNVFPYNMAVWHRSFQTLSMVMPPHNSGGASHCRGEGDVRVSTVSLHDIFDQFTPRAKVMKMDCEGAEYDIFYGSAIDPSKVVDRLAIEFHDSPLLASQGFTADTLRCDMLKSFGDRLKVVNRIENGKVVAGGW